MNKRVLGVAAGLVGIAALLVGLRSVQWVVGTDFGMETHVGLRVMELCQVVRPEANKPGVQVCTMESHDDMARSPSKPDGFETFTLVTRVTFYAGLAAVGLLLLVILLAVIGRFPSSGIAPSTLAMLASFATLVFVSLTVGVHPWKEFGWRTGYAILLAGGGACVCLFSSIVLGRLRPPVQDTW